MRFEVAVQRDVKLSLRTGLSFGLTSGVITTLGLMVGLYSGSRSTSVVLGGILTIAVADSLSDAMGIHAAEESRNEGSQRHIWEATLSTFVAKFAIAGSFAVPVFFFSLETAVIVGIGWGLLLLALLSFWMARLQDTEPWKVVLEHVSIGILVIAMTHYLGGWIHHRFS
jgi:VIT1/CCC1 family predicted Fe2+/Mn2+ transporter